MYLNYTQNRGIEMLKFDGIPPSYEKSCGGPPLSPPDEIEENTERVEVVVSSGFGIYIPQVFVESNEKKGNISDENWRICLNGPPSDKENCSYEEAWMEILDNWEYFEYSGENCTFRYFLEHDEDLWLVRQILGS